MSDTPEAARSIELANRMLDRATADPDDDLAMLSRQLLRYRDEIADLKLQLTMCAPSDAEACAEVARLEGLVMVYRPVYEAVVKVGMDLRVSLEPVS